MYEEIKNEIVAKSAVQQNLRREARTLSGVEKHAANQARKAGRPDIRSLLLAYAFLRGVPYTSVERKARLAPDMAQVRVHLMSYVPDTVEAWTAVDRWKEGTIPPGSKSAAA